MATMTAAGILKMIAPEFNKVGDDIVLFWIELVKPLINEKRFKGQYNYAVALLAAHKMKLNGLGNGVAGSKIQVADIQGLSSVSEGETSISVDTSSNTDTSALAVEYKRTIYGIQFLSLVAQHVITITIA